jgi:DNA-directed RNA polymerase subunit RPC12/RpoP
MEEIVIKCPHCKILILIKKKDINCSIFRHGVLIKTLQQIDPHSSKLLCDEYVNKGLIYGCGKPFKLIQKEDDFYPEKCDYI